MQAHPIAVIICTYCSADVITDCLDSLHATKDATLHVVVCDNASPDDTVAVVTDWAVRNGVRFGQGSEADDQPWLTLLQAPRNLGFAGGQHGVGVVPVTPQD
jgi:GT2 family glycosyltransferase